MVGSPVGCGGEGHNGNGLKMGLVSAIRVNN